MIDAVDPAWKTNWSLDPPLYGATTCVEDPVTIIQGPEADAELRKVQAVEGLNAAPLNYPLIGLSADDFERLCYALFKVSAPDGVSRAWSDVAIMVRGADAGRDLLLLAGERPWGVVQCKRLESAIALPATFREIIKLILYPDVDSSLPQIEEGTHYFLSLASEATQTVVDFFGTPSNVLSDQNDSIPAYVQEVLESYTSLSVLETSQATAKVRRLLPTLKYRFVRPVDLNGWIARENGVAARLFQHRILIDDANMTAGFSEVKSILQSMAGQLGGLPLMTDADLKLIKARMESVPETHRLSFGFASLFGFPKEMFAGEQNLKPRAERLNNLVAEIGQDYIDWLYQQVNHKAEEICTLGEVTVRVHPFARQLPAPFLGLVLKENIDKNLIGKVMSGFIEKTLGQRSFHNDDERIQNIKQTLVASGERYLRGHFSGMVGEGNLLELKKALARASVSGLHSVADLNHVLDSGIFIMRPHLDAAAIEMRRLSAHPLSIFLTDSSSIDDPNVLQRIADTVRALDGSKERHQPTKAI